MVEFGGRFSIAAEQIEYIAPDSNGSGSHPYRLTVSLKSGQACSLCYASEAARDREKASLVQQIDRERRADAERIMSRLYLIQSTVELANKRQLRVWRQLKELLGVEPETE